MTMPGILVYLPRYEGDSRDELVARGAGSLLDKSVDAIFTDVRSGPDGGRGKLVTFYPGDAPREVDLATQVWLAAPPEGALERGRYWIGHVQDARPSAGDLQRAVLYDGEPVTLRDGNQWIVPIGPLLPQVLAIDPNSGRETEVPDEEHREFMDWSQSILDLFLTHGFLESICRERVIHIPNGLKYVSMALAKNYRINPLVVGMLGLLNQHSAADATRAACGFNLLARRLEEKKNWEPPYLAAGVN